MFADPLSDSGWSNQSRSNQSHRGWTTLISFALQALAVGCLLCLPLLYTEGSPQPKQPAGKPAGQPRADSADRDDSD